MKNKKGFTLVEILAVIVVLAIITTIVTASIVNYLDNGKNAYNDSLSENAKLSAKNYYAENKGLLPTAENETQEISFRELVTGRFITKDFVDADNNSCMDKSYATVEKIKNDNKSIYIYKVCLICGEKIIDKSGCSKKTIEEIEQPEKPPVETPGDSEKSNGKYYDHEGKEITEAEWNNLCNTQEVVHGDCEKSNGKFYNHEGKEITEAEWNNLCKVQLNGKINLSVTGKGAYASSTTASISNSNKTGTFYINVTSPQDRYELDSLTCTNGGVASKTIGDSSYTHTDSGYNKTRTDTIRVTAQNGSDTVSCTANYSAKWTGISASTYSQGQTISYAGKSWTVISDSSTSTRKGAVKLALNDTYGSGAYQSDLTSSFLTSSTSTTLYYDRLFGGLSPISGSIYSDANPGITTNLTSDTYWVSSSQIYNSTAKNYYTTSSTDYWATGWTSGRDYQLSDLNRSTLTNKYSSSSGASKGIISTSGSTYTVSGGTITYKNSSLSSSTTSKYYATTKARHKMYGPEHYGQTDKNRVCFKIWGYDYRDQKYTATGEDGVDVQNASIIHEYICGGSNHGNENKFTPKSLKEFNVKTASGTETSHYYESSGEYFSYIYAAAVSKDQSSSKNSYGQYTYTYDRTKTSGGITNGGCHKVTTYSTSNSTATIKYRPTIIVRER